MAAARELDGKVALITGGGSGIGKAAARRFAAAGARVMICGRTLEKLERTVKETGREAGEVVAMRADISQRADMERLYAAVGERWGRLDIVFAHAGINGVWAPLEELAVEEWEQTIAVNLTGTYLTVKYALPLLRRRGGAIIITSSINGTTKFSDLGSSAYCASKAGQIAFMKLLALELAEANIRVNAICPGSIATDVDAHTELRDTRASEEWATYPRGAIPLTGGVPGRPEDVAELALFLASDRAAHITGTPVWIDGGQGLIQG